MRLRSIVPFALLAPLGSAAATDGAAQSVSGRVLDEARETPVAGAVVRLAEQDGDTRVEVVADSLGRFVLRPPEAGEYVVEAERIGYEPFRSPLLAMEAEGSVRFDLLMRPRPIGLEGFEVEVDAGAERADRYLRNLGESPVTLGLRWFDKSDIQKQVAPMSPATVIRNRGVPGLWVPVGNSPLTEPLCVTTPRARSPGSQKSPCAVTVVDGVVVNPVEANQIDPMRIEAMAILRPVDATTMYGTQGAGGAVLIWTR